MQMAGGGGSIRRSSWCGALLFLCLMVVLALPNASGQDYERDEDSNITIEAYNFTTENISHYDTSGWGMRLFGRLMTPTPLVQRALSNMIYILFDCGTCTPDVKSFQKRGYHEGESWSDVPRDEYWKDPEYFGGGYFIWPLTPNTNYVFRAKLGSGTTVSAFGRTCDPYVPYPDDLHVEMAAAAWMDVRWKDPNENCDGKYYFKFRYHNTDSIMFRNMVYANNITRFGMYFRNDSPGPRWIWTHLHPCPKYPKENCLFLGEHVRPNATHVISVRAIRFGSSTWEENGRYLNITKRSNLDYDAYPPSFCPPAKHVVPLWVIILIVVLIIMAIIAIIVLAELLRRQKIKEAQLDRGQREEAKEARKEKHKQEREERKKKMKKEDK